jgi:hypothetical protein
MSSSLRNHSRNEDFISISIAPTPRKQGYTIKESNRPTEAEPHRDYEAEHRILRERLSAMGEQCDALSSENEILRFEQRSAHQELAAIDEDHQRALQALATLRDHAKERQVATMFTSISHCKLQRISTV